MNFELLKRLHEEGMVSPQSFEKIEQRNASWLFSLHWEIRTILYLGVLLLSTGLGILIYQNIDTIGHQVILLIIALVCGSCFFYCFKHGKPFSKEQVRSTGSFFDYILLLGTLSFLTFVGYLQYQYNVFGTNYGLATFIPMVVLFYVAYQFDHIGILNLAITNLGLWMGVSLAPQQLLTGFDHSNQTVVYTYMLLGVLLLTAAFFTDRYHFKKHFSFSYMHFGIHVLFISLLADYFFYLSGNIGYLVLAAIFGFAFYVYNDALKKQSFYFILLAVLYSYIAFSSQIINLIFKAGDGEGAFVLAFLYFIASAVGIIISLMQLNKKLKTL